MIKLYKSDDRVSLKEREYVDDVYTVVSKESMNMEDDLRGIYVDDSLDALEDELSAEGFEYYDEGICLAPADCLYRIWKNDKYKILIYFGNDDNIVYNIYVKEKNTTLESVCSRKRKLREQDVEIEVRHEGILEVPEGKNVDDLPVSHFVNLAKKKGLSKITKALNNLQVWNKKKNPSLSKWAGDMIDKVSKKMEKKESWYPRVPSGYSWRTIAIPKDDDIEAEVEELLVDYKSSDDRIEWDIDYNGGMFGDDRVISIYSNGDVYTELKYKISDMWDSYNYDLAESLKLKESGMYDYYDTPDNEYGMFTANDMPTPEDEWWASIPSKLRAVVHEMEEQGWEGVGFTTTGVDYCLSKDDKNRPELSYEMCVSIYDRDTSVSLSRYVEVYNWEKEKEISRIPNTSGVAEFITPQDVKKFSKWFNRLGTDFATT